jgi:hypothetical protein
VGAHADLEATRNAMATAGDPARVVELQTQCARANAEKCATYWRRFYELGAQTQARLAQCMVLVPPPTGSTAVDDSKQAVLTFIDQAYRQWLDAAQQLYRLPATLAPSKGEARTADVAR